MSVEAPRVVSEVDSPEKHRFWARVGRVLDIVAPPVEEEAVSQHLRNILSPPSKEEIERRREERLEERLKAWKERGDIEIITISPEAPDLRAFEET